MRGVTKATGHNWRFKDETGKRYGRLTVIEFAGHRDHKAVWRCTCDCGGTKLAVGRKLRDGETSSCGCLQREKARARVLTHGASDTVEYRIFQGMIERCYNPKCEGYQWYGAKGVGICERWRSNFPLFLSDMGHRPSALHSIDRINTFGNYEPGNCKWSTASEQVNNRRHSVRITALGKTLSIRQWSNETGLNYDIIANRRRVGWNPEEIVTTPRIPTRP